MLRLLAPRFWGVHLLALLAVSAAGVLGLWQHDAWRADRAAQAVDLSRAEPLALDEALGPDDPFPGDRVGQPVQVDGTWVPEGTLYVSGRVQDGRSGYWAMTPLATPGGSALLVVRGWTPDPAEAPAPPSGPASLLALLLPPEGTGETDADPTDDVLPQVRIADAIQHVDQDLYGAFAIAEEGPTTQGLVPVTVDREPDVGLFTAGRNLLYAVQWWIFGGFALFMWWRYLADELAVAAAVEDDPGDDPGDGPGDEPGPAVQATGDAVPSNP